MNPLTNWQEEMRSSFLYDVASKSEKSPVRQEMFAKLSKEAASQAGIWAETIAKLGKDAPSKYAPDLRTLFIARLVGLFGPKAMRPLLAASKVRGLSVYSDERPDNAPPMHPIEMEKRHRSGSAGGLLRAAVFGASDGLVSNASLILGVAGATNDPSVVILSGTAGLLAGAFSMATGEYVSVRSQREMFEYQIGLEREELEEYPEAEALELAVIYEAKGLSKEEAKAVAKKVLSDPEKALDTLAREELGINPEQLGEPYGAAFSSFISFAVGALIPMLPFLLWKSSPALPVTVVISAVSLFGIGAAIALLTGRSLLWGGLRLLLLGAAAGGATFLVGQWLGVKV